MVLSSSPTPPPTLWLDRAYETLLSDPRNASVSALELASDLGLEGRKPLSAHSSFNQTIAANRPSLGWLMVGSSTDGLVRAIDADSGVVEPEAVRKWASQVTNRGFRHLLLCSDGAGFSPRPDPGDMAPDMAAELLDPLSASSACLNAWIADHAALRIILDGSWLGKDATGAQVATVRWVAALASHPGVESVQIANLPGGRLPEYATVLTGHEAVHSRSGRSPVADVFWRPYQPDEATLMSIDRAKGHRVVATVLDLIEFSNPSYAADPRRHLLQRERLRRYLRQSDIVTGISEDVLAELAREVPGIEARRLVLTTLGIDHITPVAPDGRPRELDQEPVGRTIGSRPYLLVLGNDFAHKNRDFAIRVWERVNAHTQVDLVLAGSKVGGGSSALDEARILARVRGETGEARCHLLDYVSSEAKAWLLSRAAVVLYPTSSEGFGLLPHEAAAHGIPCVYTAFGPLTERGPGDSGLPSWDVDLYAQRTVELLTSAEARRDCVERMREVDSRLTWQAAAAELVEAFRASLRLPPQPYGLWERDVRPPSRWLGADPDVRMSPRHARLRATRATYGSVPSRTLRRLKNLVDRDGAVD